MKSIFTKFKFKNMIGIISIIYISIYIALYYISKSAFTSLLILVIILVIPLDIYLEWRIRKEKENPEIGNKITKYKSLVKFLSSLCKVMSWIWLGILFILVIAAKKGAFVIIPIGGLPAIIFLMLDFINNKDRLEKSKILNIFIKKEKNEEKQIINKFNVKFIFLVIAIGIIVFLIPTFIKQAEKANIKYAEYKCKLKSIEIVRVDNDVERPGNVKVSFKLHAEGEGTYYYGRYCYITPISNKSQYKEDLRSEITKTKDDILTISIGKLTEGTYELTINKNVYDTSKLSKRLKKKLKNELTLPVKAKFKVSNGYMTIKDIDKAISDNEKAKALEAEKKLKAQMEEEKKLEAQRDKERKEFEKNRYKKEFETEGIEKWRIYVESGRTLGIKGNAGHIMCIEISDESDKILVSELISGGSYDKHYILNNRYNGYYTVTLRYNSYYKYNWEFSVY